MHACRICGAGTVSAGSRRGDLSGRDFELRRCEACGFGFVAEPRTDYDAIYDDAYYAGRGVDPLVDYVYEFEHPLETVRRYEWHGIVTAVSALTSVGPDTAWLDYGCGTGGLFFLTTGNAGPRHGDLVGWSYVRPEIHVSFFEPRTLAEALRRTGFEPAFPGYGPGWPDIIRFKLLKNLGRKRAGRLDGLLPWGPIARTLDRRYGLSGHPVGWAA